MQGHREDAPAAADQVRGTRGGFAVTDAAIAIAIVAFFALAAAYVRGCDRL